MYDRTFYAEIKNKLMSCYRTIYGLFIKIAKSVNLFDRGRLPKMMDLLESARFSSNVHGRRAINFN